MKPVLMRFARAFVAGGLSNMLIVIAANHSISTYKDLNAWIVTLAVACVTGGIMALDKLIRS